MKLIGNKVINVNKLKVFFIFLTGILFILFLFPRQGKFRYEFQKGKPWRYEVLVAPFDVPIYKYESVIQAERDSALKSFIPYYRLDTLIVTYAMESFRSYFTEVWDEYVAERRSDNTFPYRGSTSRIRSGYSQEISALIEDVYSNGIVSDARLFHDIRNNRESVNVITGQVVEERSKSKIFTQSTAYEYIKKNLDDISIKTEPKAMGGKRFTDYLDPVRFIKPNLFYDEETSEKIRTSILSEISETQGMIQAGEKIIALGEVINDEKQQILISLRREYETNPDVIRNFNVIFLGQLIIVCFSFLVLYLFLFHFRREVLQSAGKTFFIVLLVLIMAFLSNITIKAQSISLFVMPMVILPIILKTFYDARIALFVHIITILIISFWAPNSFEFIFMNFIAGVVAIFTLRNLYRRGILFITAVFTFISYSLIYIGINIMQDGQFENLDMRNFAWFGGNALLVLASYPLIYIFEKTFGFISDATLLELSDTNQPLLRKLAELAPGTFHHSLQVANLAEEAALLIGGNTLLIRTGALYHDIGKMDDPMYFIENLTSTFNPHENLEFEESAEKIISHVTKGYEIAKKHKLPQVIIDFILTHHGTSTVQYFYKSYLKEFPGTDIDRDKFSYPGPVPFSRETSILMMADSIEAASRSLKKISRETISELVDQIVKYQLDEKQFTNTNLTYRDIENIKEVFKNKLQNIYHARVVYPK